MKLVTIMGVSSSNLSGSPNFSGTANYSCSQSSPVSPSSSGSAKSSGSHYCFSCFCFPRCCNRIARYRGKWKNETTLEFAPRKYKTIQYSALIGELSEVLNVDEAIIEVFAYDAKLEYPVPKALISHRFIVFRTERWWYSIEKNDKGVVLQKRKSKEMVTDQIKGNDRKNASSPKHCSCSSKTTIRDLFHWLSDEGELGNEYKLSDANCRHFANKVYDFVSEKL